MTTKILQEVRIDNNSEDKEEIIKLFEKIITTTKLEIEQTQKGFDRL